MLLTNMSMLVIAKEPLPGRAKTRLTPPCSPDQAASLAAAALRDTLDAVAAAPVSRRVLVFEGDASDWAPEGFEVIAQRGAGLGERLAAAFEDVDGPALLVGMDTPQLTAEDLSRALESLGEPGVDALIAPTDDGGYWCVGFTRPAPGAFTGVPMSTDRTYAAQRARFDELGLNVALAPPLRDVDDISDAQAVAAQAPASRFAAALAACEQAGLGLAA